jgi:UDP-N-acetyl-D-mannosaminuronic acid dehydrogenase
MAALLADATRRLDAVPGEVVVVQRNSPTSGWKVEAINQGVSPIGGVEPDLDHLVRVNAEAGILRASHDWSEVGGADVILVCVQTDKDGMGPDYGPLLEALHGIAGALAAAPVRKCPLIVIESTLAPSSMHSVVRPLFAGYGLLEGRDVLLGNSPNRVMPGRLVERVASADKIVGALHPGTATRIAALYGRIVTAGQLLQTSSLTAEVVKTLENAYRDVRIAFAAELARYCDANDIDFFALRDALNIRLARTDAASRDGSAVPTGAVLVPTVGVGGHCLPKDGILMWWRAAEAGVPTLHSLILASRAINDESPARTLALVHGLGEQVAGKRIAVLGAAYRPDSEDTRNSPALTLARLLRAEGADVVVHDPYVRPSDANLAKAGFTTAFTQDLAAALHGAHGVLVACGHAVYRDLPAQLVRRAPWLSFLIDGANLFRAGSFAGHGLRYAGIGRGSRPPGSALLESALAQFRAVERGVANEVERVAEFLTARFADGGHNAVRYTDVQSLARTCATGCDLVNPGPVDAWPPSGFSSRLARLAAEGARTSRSPEAAVA